MNPLIWYIPLHLVMGSLVVWMLARVFLKSFGEITVLDCIVFALSFAIWPSGFMAGLILSLEEGTFACPRWLNPNFVIYRRKP